MTKHTGLRRACSLRLPKGPGLLDRGSWNGSLEEAPLPWEAREGPRGAEGSLGHGREGASQVVASKKKGSYGRRPLSLKGQDGKEEEAALAGEASDGQLLLGQADHKAHASKRVKRCQKVNLTVQRGWQSFLAHMYRLGSASLPIGRW